VTENNKPSYITPACMRGP